MSKLSGSTGSNGFRTLGMIAGTAAMLLSVPASASLWSGGNGVWSSDGDPGWNGTGVPDGQGAVAEFTTSGTATLDSGITLGSFVYRSGGNATRTITVGGNSITFDQDGAGAGYAVVSNSCTRGGDRISFGSGTVTLADDILLINIGACSGSYSIGFSSTIGGSGNMTVYNVSNDPDFGPVTLSGPSKFSGTFWLQKGAVEFTNTGLGDSANPVILGSAGNGSATLISTGSSTAVPNPITVTAGTGGTLLLGSSSASSTSSSTFSGPITLNDDLTVTSAKTSPATLKFSNAISGVGALTKIGAGPVTLTAANAYEGGTAVVVGTLLVTGSGSLGTGSVTVSAGATLALETGATIDDDASVALLKDGASYGIVDLTSGVDETVGTLSLDGAVQLPGSYGATGSGATIINDDYFVGSGTLTATGGAPAGTLITLR